MKHYYVSDVPQVNGDYEVHHTDCNQLKEVHRKTYLGYFASYQQAITKANTIYTKTNGCPICSSHIKTF